MTVTSHHSSLARADERLPLANGRPVSRSVISSPVWKKATSTVTVLMVGAAVLLGVSIGAAGPAVSPVTPAVAAAAADPAAADPAAVDPGTTDPGTADPGTADPAPNGPGQGRGTAPRAGNGGQLNGRR